MEKESKISDLGDSGSPYISNQTRLVPRWLGTGYGWRITVWLVKSRYKEGFDAIDIAKQLGISKSTVERQLIRMEIESQTEGHDTWVFPLWQVAIHSVSKSYRSIGQDTWAVRYP